MSSAQYWLRFLHIIGLLQYCVCSRLYPRDYIKVPINYQDTESNRYETEDVEYDVVDQKQRMWGEEDHLKVTPSPDDEALQPRFTTISSRTVIPDQSELDQVDEKALKRGHEEITVDKDDETVTEVIEDDVLPSSLPFTIKSKLTVPQSMFVRNITKHHNLTNTEFQSINQATINKDNRGYFFNKSKNKSSDMTLASGEQGEDVTENSTGTTIISHQGNLLQTAQTIDNSSSTSQRSANFSLPLSISEETNKVDSIGKKFKNLSQSTNLFHDENATSQIQSSDSNTTKASITSNQSSTQSSLMPSTSTQNSNTEIYNESSPFGNKSVGKTIIQDKLLDLTNLQKSNMETAKLNNRSQSTDAASTDLTQNVKSIAGKTVPTSTQDIGKTSVFNDTKTLVLTSNVTSQRNNSLSALSKTKKEMVDRLEQRMNVLLRSHNNNQTKKPKEQQARMKNHSDNGLGSFLPTNIRRMKIIHHHAAPRKQASRKLKSFLTAVKQMFKAPETTQDILAWEAWGQCSKTCGQRAVRTRQRKCAKLVARDFDVACPGPRKQKQKCPVVSCLAKHDRKSSQELTKTTKSQNNVSHRSNNDLQNIDEMSGKDPDNLRGQATNAVNKFIGNQDNDGVSITSRLNTEEQTDNDATSPTEDSEGTTEGYGGSSVQEYQSNVASVQTANQKRYLYTVWGSWSACTRTCGQRAYAFRKRYCINAVTGEIKRHCQKPTILAKKCLLTPCPVDGGLSDWSKWSSCSANCGIMERHRSCTNPKPAFGGRECFKLPVQMRLCGTCTEDKVLAVQKLPSYSPRVLCGFDPCQRVGCLEDKGAICVTDFECNPTFFDDEGNVLKRCRDSTQLFLRPLAQKKCSFNPCSFTKCDVHGTKCLVDTKCRPFFVNEMGKRVNCKGSNVLQISSELICGFNPCKITTCTVDPEAKCVTDYRCNPIFINAAGQRISGCTEDEVEEAERLSTERPTAVQQSTENPSARDVTPSFQYPYNAHTLQKYGEDSSVKKTIQNDLHETKKKLKDIKLLEDIFTRRSHHDENFKNKINSGKLKKGYPDVSGHYLKTSLKSLGKETLKANGIKLLEHILQHHLHPSKSVDSTNSIVSEKSKKIQDKAKGKSENRGIKLLEHILQVHMHSSKGLHSKKSMAFEKTEKFQDKTNDKSEKDFQKHNNDSENGSKTLIGNSNKTNTATDFNLLNAGDRMTSDEDIKVKTLYQNKDETTDIVDSPSFASNSLHSSKNQVLEKSFTNKNSVDPSEKLFQSKTLTDKIIETDSNTKASLTMQGKSKSKSLKKEERKNLADVDRFILDELYKKKKMGTTSLGLSRVSHGQGNVTLNVDGVRGYMGESILNSEVRNNEGNSSGYNNNNNWNNDNNESNNDTSKANNNNISIRNDNDNNNNNNNISSLNDNNSNNNNNFDNSYNNLNSRNISRQDQENILKNQMKETNKIINNPLTTASTANSNNSSSSNNNVVISGNNSNNDITLKSDYNKNVSNNFKPSETPPTVINSNPPLQNNTIHYNLGLVKIPSTKTENKSLDTKLRIHSRPQIPKTSSNKKLKDRKNDNIKEKAIAWEEYIANMKNMKEGSVLLDNANEINHGKPSFDHNQSDDSSVDDTRAGKLKLVDGSKMTPGYEEEETTKPGTGVIHSSDPNLEISPYDDEVTKSAFEKEQSENPEGIPSKAELNRILNSVSDSKSGNQASHTMPGNLYDQHADHELKYPITSSYRPPLSPAQQVNQATNKPVAQATNRPVNLVIDKPVNQVTDTPVNQVTDIPVNTVTKQPINQIIDKPVNQVSDTPVNHVTDIQVNRVTKKPINQIIDKPVNQVTDRPSQNDVITKLVLKAVQRELAKLKLDEVLKDSLKNIKPKARQGLDETTKIFTPKPNTGYLGVAKKPSDNHAYLGLSKGYQGLNLKIHGQPAGKGLFSTPKPFKAFSTNVPIFEDKKESHSYHEQASDTDSEQDWVGSRQHGDEADKSNNLDVENLREIDEILKNSYAGNDIEKTTEKPDQTNIPEENNINKIVESSNQYTYTLAPMKEEVTENDNEDQTLPLMKEGVSENHKEDQTLPLMKEKVTNNDREDQTQAPMKERVTENDNEDQAQAPMKEGVTENDNEDQTLPLIKEGVSENHKEDQTLPLMKEKVTNNDREDQTLAPMKEGVSENDKEDQTLPLMKERVTENDKEDQAQAPMKEGVSENDKEDQTLPLMKERVTENDKEDQAQAPMKERVSENDKEDQTLPLMKERVTENDKEDQAQAPMKEGVTENDKEDQTLPLMKEKVTENDKEDQTNKDREEQTEPAYKESYSPALANEIKELGLHEYYIKDGFQTPGVPKYRKIADGQLPQVLKSHHSQDDYHRQKSHPVGYKKKFHLAQVEMLPSHSALRQHNSEGDEIERVPNNYRQANGFARSHTSPQRVGSLAKYLDHLRHYVSGMDSDLLDSRLKSKHRNGMTQEDLGNAIILNAKDDGNVKNSIENSENFIEDFKTPRNREIISQKDDVFADETGKNGVMVFKVSDDDANYRRTLRYRHPKTYSKKRQSIYN